MKMRLLGLVAVVVSVAAGAGCAGPAEEEPVGSTSQGLGIVARTRLAVGDIHRGSVDLRTKSEQLQVESAKLGSAELDALVAKLVDRAKKMEARSVSMAARAGAKSSTGGVAPRYYSLDDVAPVNPDDRALAEQAVAFMQDGFAWDEAWAAARDYEASQAAMNEAWRRNVESVDAFNAGSSWWVQPAADVQANLPLFQDYDAFYLCCL